MSLEIERKFLVKNDSFKKNVKGILYKQGYLGNNESQSIRVRVVENKAFLTIKSTNNDINRLEFEYEIPLADANEIIHKLCNKPIIEKYRYKLEYGGFLWEIDEFLGENLGLIIAEIELPDANTQFSIPEFIENEVTGDKRYYNSYIAGHPFNSWRYLK